MMVLFTPKYNCQLRSWFSFISRQNLKTRICSVHRLSYMSWRGRCGEWVVPYLCSGIHVVPWEKGAFGWLKLANLVCVFSPIWVSAFYTFINLTAWVAYLPLISFAKSFTAYLSFNLLQNILFPVSNLQNSLPADQAFTECLFLT